MQGTGLDPRTLLHHTTLSPCVCVCVCVLIAQSCLTLGNPTDCSLPGSSVHGILQARILEWIAIRFSRQSPYTLIFYFLMSQSHVGNSWQLSLKATVISVTLQRLVVKKFGDFQKTIYLGKESLTASATDILFLPPQKFTLGKKLVSSGLKFSVDCHITYLLVTSLLGWNCSLIGVLSPGRGIPEGRWVEEREFLFMIWLCFLGKAALGLSGPANIA